MQSQRVTSRFSRVLFERIPGTQGFWRVEPVIDLKQLNAHIDVPHFHMHTISSVLNIHILVHPNSKKYLRFAFENKVNQFRVLPFGLNTAPRVFTRLGHTVAAYLHRQGILVIPYLDDWLIHHPNCQVLLCHQSQ